MKRILIYIIAFIVTLGANAQRPNVDSLKKVLQQSQRDTNYVKTLIRFAEIYYFSKPDSCRLLAEEALQLARELNYPWGVAKALNTAAESQRFLGDYPKAIRYNLEALTIHRERKDTLAELFTLSFLGFSYMEFKEYRTALGYIFEALKRIDDKLRQTFNLSNAGNAYQMMQINDSALFFARLAYKNYSQIQHGPLKSLVLTRLGNAFTGINQKDSALLFYHAAMENAIKANDGVNLSKILRALAKYYQSFPQSDSSWFYARQAFAAASRSNQRLDLMETSNLLTTLFRNERNIDSAFYYQDYAKAMSDSLYGPGRFKQLQLLMLEEQRRQQELRSQVEKTQIRTKSRYRTIAFSVTILFVGLLAFFVWRNLKRQKKVNFTLREQQEKITIQNIELEKALEELKSTQSQLIQREKMASLGELTSGIAHEIQNPLNFVNNFSELNKELLVEMIAALEKGQINEAKTLAANLVSNEDKITEHGKRADSIVKAMLQHSRTGGGDKEPTNINVLAEEYSRLAYHGWRAKDKSFNSELVTDFDRSMTIIQVVPQEIGRVILNLLNNAFYAVTDKQKLQLTGYKPKVTITTKNAGDKVIITVTDNGNGVPERVKEKIFQPFFTTKSAGQGTGLGLSLSYDIVTKRHGGSLAIDSREGEGSQFIVMLPLTNNA